MIRKELNGQWKEELHEYMNMVSYIHASRRLGQRVSYEPVCMHVNQRCPCTNLMLKEKEISWDVCAQK